MSMQPNPAGIWNLQHPTQYEIWLRMTQIRRLVLSIGAESKPIWEVEVKEVKPMPTVVSLIQSQQSHSRYIYKYTCIYTYICTCRYIHIYICICVCIYIYIYIYIDTYINIDIYVQVCIQEILMCERIHPPTLTHPIHERFCFYDGNVENNGVLLQDVA